MEKKAKNVQNLSTNITTNQKGKISTALDLHVKKWVYVSMYVCIENREFGEH